MSYALPYARANAAAYAGASARAAFIRRTYLHVAGAVLGLALIDLAIFNLVPREQLARLIGSYFSIPFSQFITLAAFIGVGFLARMWAYQGGSQLIQYVGLSLAVVFWAVFLVPLLFLAVHFSDDKVLPSAVIMTLAMFGGLTAAVLVTRKDFSFLGSILPVVSFLMLGLIIAALVTGFSLGVWFSFLAVALACGSILYDTSNVLHHFRTDMHVAAALELFCSIAYLFYYVLLIMMQTQSNRN